MNIQNYPGGFGTGMGKYGEENYPQFLPGNKVKITLPLYSKKFGEKKISIGEGYIIDAPVYDGKKPYLIKLYKYATDDYDYYPNKYNGMDIEKNSYLLVSGSYISIVT